MNGLISVPPMSQSQSILALPYEENFGCKGDSKIKFIPSLKHGDLVEPFDLFDVNIHRRNCSSLAEDQTLTGLVNRVYKFQRLSPDVNTAPNSFFVLQNKDGQLLSCAGCQNAHQANTRFTSVIKQGIAEENTETEYDCYIGPFAAEPGHGYGKILLSTIEKIISNHGFKRVVLDVYNKTDMHMNGYYQKLGYSPNSHRLYKLEGGEIVTQTRYVKRLSE